MKNNSLVFLGFVIICLVNLSARGGDGKAKLQPALPEAKISVQPVAKDPASIVRVP